MCHFDRDMIVVCNFFSFEEPDVSGILRRQLLAYYLQIWSSFSTTPWFFYSRLLDDRMAGKESMQPILVCFQ
jgi:hypothetical protein